MLQIVTYLSYIWNYLGQGQIASRQQYNSFRLKSSLFSWLQWPRVLIYRRCVQNFIAWSLSYVIGLSDKITHMAVKIAVTREYEDEKRHVHSNRLLLSLLQKKSTAFSDICFNFWRLFAWLVYQTEGNHKCSNMLADILPADPPPQI